MGDDDDRCRKGMSVMRMRAKRFTLSIVMALCVALAGCTPAEIEQSIGLVQQSFESGGVDGAIITGTGIVQVAIPVIGYRLGSAGF
jgi:hypothetical protein